MATVTEKAGIFSRCNIPEALVRRLSSNSKINTGGQSQEANSAPQPQQKQTFSRSKRNSAPAVHHHESSNPNHKNKANLEKLLLSVPLANDVVNFSDTEGPVGRLPLYSDNYESESFCLPSSGYKSDSEGRGRSRYKIRTSQSANPTPDQSPERPAVKASVRRTQSLNSQADTERALEIRRRLRNCKREEVIPNNKTQGSNNNSTSTNVKSNIHERLKQLGIRGLNTTNLQPQQKTVYDTRGQRGSLRSRSLNQLPDTEKSTARVLQQKTTTGQTNRLTGAGTVQRSRSFNSKIRTSDNNKQAEASTNNSKSATQKPQQQQQQQQQQKPIQPSTSKTLQPSQNSAFAKVQKQFGEARQRNSLSASSDNLRSSSFSTLQDAWESRRAFQKTTDTINNTNSRVDYSLIGDTNRLHPQATGGHINSFSDIEHSDVISRRRERRRLKREIYNQRHQSDKSDSETETEDSHFARHALERLERRRSNSNPRRTPSRNLRSQQDLDNNSDSNDENNNECPSDKTLDSGVFDLALSNLSANISNLSKRYNSDEFLAADCLSPKSGYSSATESLAESLAESTTTFYESPDDHDRNMDRTRKHGITGSKSKPGGSYKQKGDKTNAKTAVLNSTRANGNLMSGQIQTKQQNNSSSSVNKRELTSKSSSSQLSSDPIQTLQINSTADLAAHNQTKPQKAKTINKKQSLTLVDKSSSKATSSSSNTSNSSITPTPPSTAATEEKHKLEKRPSNSKQPPPTKQKPDKHKENTKTNLTKVNSGTGVVVEDSVCGKKSAATPTSSRPTTPSSVSTKTKLNKTDSNSSIVNSESTNSRPSTPSSASKKNKLNKTDSSASTTSRPSTPSKTKLNKTDSNSSVNSVGATEKPVTTTKSKVTNSNNSSEKNENTNPKKQPPPVHPKTKRNSVVVDNNKPEIIIPAVAPKVEDTTTSPKHIEVNDEKKLSPQTPTTPVKTPTKCGGLTERKVSHHRCCAPHDERSESPSHQQQKKTRRVSHQGCFSPVDKLHDNSTTNSNNNSRSNTPTKTRRVSHVGCFTPTEIVSENDSRSTTPTRNRRVSHQNSFKPVNSSDSSDSSRSNTPTVATTEKALSPTNARTNNERRISHHNCVDSLSPNSPTREQERKRRHSLQHNHSTTMTDNKHSTERKMSNTNTNYRVNMKAAIVVGPALKKDEIKPKLARECLSLSLSLSNHHQQQDSDSPQSCSSPQLSRIDENRTNDTTRTDNSNTKHIIAETLSSDDNEITQYNSPSQQQKYHRRRNKNDVQREERRADEMSSPHHNHNTKSPPNLNFSIDQSKSTIESRTGNKQHRLIKHGEQVEVRLSLENKITASESTVSPSGKAPPNVAPKPVTSSNSSNSQERDNKRNSSLTTTQTESLHKGTQCLLLTGETQLSGKVVTVSDFTKAVTFNENIVKELGTDILDNIKFTYPEYLLTKEQKQKLEKDILKQEEQLESDSEIGDECVDETDSAAPKNKNNTDTERLQKEKLKSLNLKMENTRLQELLYEVEKARSGTMKALLHVNTALNKVQGENTQMEGELKVSGHENHQLKENIQIYIEKEKASVENLGGGSGGRKANDRSLSIFVDQWKREKKELMGQLNILKGKNEESEQAATRLQVQYKKVKEQLEHSNNAFTTTLKNNLEATKRMEEELKNSMDEKQDMLKRMNENNKYKRQLDTLKVEMEELKTQNEELQDENESLEQKCKHFEKQKRQMQLEEEELHEQIGHSQEIIEKLTDVESELKERLQAEIVDKEYLQECLDETGNILYLLRNNESKLKQDRDLLLDDLEQELEEKQSLQTTLNMTMDEHKEIVGRLQNMTNIHSNVKESLQQATKNEKNYQDQIEALTKTNHILHYTLEKEKEEKMDLQEMFDIVESDHKKFKNENVGRSKDMENRQDELSFENRQLKAKFDEIDNKCKEMQESLEQKEEENSTLTQKLIRLEKLKEAADQELENFHDNSEAIEKTKSELQKSNQEREVDLKIARQRVEKLTCSLEETEETLERATKDLNETKRRLDEYRDDYDDLQSKSRERMKKIRDLESSNEELSEQKERYHNRMSYYESETKDLRKKVNEQTEEIGTLQIESQRFQRERDTHRRNCDMAVNDFETHKTKCSETLKRLKDEIMELSSKILEKDRLAMKQKEHFQDQIEDRQNDVNFLRSMLDGDIKRSVQGGVPKRKTSEASDSSSEKLDIGILKNSHDKFRDEFQSHVNKLEDLLKNSNHIEDTVTVVKSPMSNIKLEELKQIRDEMFELQAELTTVKTKHADLLAEITSVKLDTSSTSSQRCRDVSLDERLEDLEIALEKVNELISRIESRHEAVMTRNAVLLQRTLKEDDRTAKDLVKKFQIVSLDGENKQLKTLLGILKKKYDFDETELADELKKANLLSDTDTVSTSLNLNNNNLDSDDDLKTTRSPISSRTSLRGDRTAMRSSSTRRAQRNYSFFNAAVGAPDMNSTTTSAATTRGYSRDPYQRSSGFSSFSSEDEDYTPTPRLPKRYNTLPSRARRPKV